MAPTKKAVFWLKPTLTALTSAQSYWFDAWKLVLVYYKWLWALPLWVTIASYMKWLDGKATSFGFKWKGKKELVEGAYDCACITELSVRVLVCSPASVMALGSLTAMCRNPFVTLTYRGDFVWRMFHFPQSFPIWVALRCFLSLRSHWTL